ncbi:uncharacterized protein LOC105157632 [Sesamum indicum]|uniref:Uncharacterized protein LOC105157632 n=1 Tax=Sesamum indicum TaxID=4182 RepID=A0A6I9SR78_SESIN|nr:uncharacterized protein LOC105157632 [Sesamum indicum]
MLSKASRTKLSPQMLIKETLHRTKKFFHRAFTNLKSFILGRYQKLPKTPCANPINCTMNSKLHGVDNFCRSLSQQWDNSTETVKKKERHLSPEVQTKGDDQCSKSFKNAGDCSELEHLKEGKISSGRKQEESSLLAAVALAQKMKELEMMDVNDMDHVMDVEEVLHFYSRLTCPAYLEIVDKFFMDMYSEFNVPQASRSSSMRKLGSAASVHSSMRSLGPLKL